MLRIILSLGTLTALALPSTAQAQSDSPKTSRFFFTVGIGGHTMQDSVKMEFGPEIFANVGYFIVPNRVSIGAEFAMSGHGTRNDSIFNTSALAGHYVAEIRVFVTSAAKVGVYLAPRFGWTTWTADYIYDTDVHHFVAHGVLAGGRAGVAIPVTRMLRAELGGTMDYGFYGDIVLEGYGVIAPDSKALQAGGYAGISFRF